VRGTGHLESASLRQYGLPALRRANIGGDLHWIPS
jgi:hypothetical protein